MKIPAILFFFILLISPIALLLAQPSSPAPVPIDGGASILAVAGMAYGIKKYRDFHKRK